MAFHSASFGTTASASDDSVRPVNRLHAVPLDHLLRLAHAVGGIAGRILDEQLDLAPEDAALGVLHLGVELGAALGLLADGAERARSGRPVCRS